MPWVPTPQSSEGESDWPILGQAPTLIQSLIAKGGGPCITIMAAGGGRMWAVQVSGKMSAERWCLGLFLVIFRIRKSISDE